LFTPLGIPFPLGVHPFIWQDAYHKIKQAEMYWRADIEANRRLAASLQGRS
jgi:hypothetical protein